MSLKASIWLLLQLFQCDLIITTILVNHSGLRLQVWSCVPRVLQSVAISKSLCENTTGNGACYHSIPSEVFSISSRIINVWPVMDPSLVWHNTNASLISLTPSSHFHGDWPSKHSSKHEVDDKVPSIFVSQFFVVLKWHSLWATHQFLESKSEPSIGLNVLLQPIAIKNNDECSNLLWLTNACSLILIV